MNHDDLYMAALDETDELDDFDTDEDDFNEDEIEGIELSAPMPLSEPVTKPVNPEYDAEVRFKNNNPYAAYQPEKLEEVKSIIQSNSALTEAEVAALVEKAMTEEVSFNLSDPSYRLMITWDIAHCGFAITNNPVQKKDQLFSLS